MQVVPLPNPVTAVSASSAAKPASSGAFTAALAATISNSASVRAALPSENKNSAKPALANSDRGPDAQGVSSPAAQPDAGGQALAGTEARFSPQTVLKPDVPLASHPAPKTTAKFENDSECSPDAASNKSPQGADFFVAATVPQALSDVAVAINGLPLPAQPVVVPQQESTATGTSPTPSASDTQPAAPAPISVGDGRSETNVTPVGLSPPNANLSASLGIDASAKFRVATAGQLSPTPGADQTAAGPSFTAAQKAPKPVGSDLPAEFGADQIRSSSRLSGAVTNITDPSAAHPAPSPNFTVSNAAGDDFAKALSQTVAASPTPAPAAEKVQQMSGVPAQPLAPIGVAAASSPAAPRSKTGEVRTFELDPKVRVFSFTSSAPTPSPLLPGTSHAPASNPRVEIQQPVQKADHPADTVAIYSPLAVSQDPAVKATASAPTSTVLPPPTPSAVAPLNAGSPANANPNDAVPDHTASDAEQLPPAAVQNQKGGVPSLANVSKKSAAMPSDTPPSQDVIRPYVADKSPAIAPAVPTAVPVSSSTTPTKADQPSDLPKTQQMLDSALPASTTPPNAHFTPPATNDAQMHVGIRTTAFGAVEIHTTIVQNQVGISVHGERGLAQWFSSEVSNIESGLKDHRLNLTAVDFSSGRSGVQTATSFQHGHPSQDFFQTAGSPAAFGDQDTASESATEFLPPDLSVGRAENRVSIHA